MRSTKGTAFGAGGVAATIFEEGQLDNETRYRNALLWAFDRLSVDGGMSLAEQRATMREIGAVLTGRLSRAAAYVPQEWSEGAKLKTATR